MLLVSVTHGFSQVYPEPRIRRKPFETVSKTARQLRRPAKARCELE